jgi:hypothetical protein
MLEQIQKWVADPKRKYNEGLDFFKQFATPQQKKDFQSYFEGVEDVENVEQFDAHFTLLVNQIVFIQNRMKANPEAYQEAVAQEPTKVVKLQPVAPKEISLDELPDHLADERARLREIVPIMAKLHAEMSNETIADDKRLELVTELVKLDNERRAIWEKIDADMPEGTVVKTDDDEQVVEKNMLTLGATLAKRVTTLKGQINKNEKALQGHLEKNNDKKAENSRTTLEAQRAELAQLQALLGESEE